MNESAEGRPCGKSFGPRYAGRDGLGPTGHRYTCGEDGRLCPRCSPASQRHIEQRISALSESWGVSIGDNEALKERLRAEFRAAESAARRAALDEVFDWLRTKLSHCMVDESLCLLCELEKGIKAFMDGEQPDAGRHKTYAAGLREGQERMRARAATAAEESMCPCPVETVDECCLSMSDDQCQRCAQDIRALEVEDG